MPLRRPRLSLSDLMALVALAALVVVMLRRPEASTLLLSFALIALLGAAWSRSRGRSGLIGGLLAGTAATVTFQAAELAYYPPIRSGYIPVSYLINVACAPLVGAAIGGAAGLIVWGVGSLTGWPTPRGASDGASDRAT